LERGFIAVETRTGEALQSTAAFSNEQLEEDKVLKSGPIRCAAVSEAFKYLAEVGEDKVLKVWDVNEFKVVSSRCAPFPTSFYVGVELNRKDFIARELPKKPTSVMFTKDSHTIIVSDKFGDVFRCVNPPFTCFSTEFIPLATRSSTPRLPTLNSPLKKRPHPRIPTPRTPIPPMEALCWDMFPLSTSCFLPRTRVTLSPQIGTNTSESAGTHKDTISRATVWVV
jgi:hypothetical protein